MLPTWFCLLSLLMKSRVQGMFRQTSSSDRTGKALLTIILITILSPGMRGDYILQEERVVVCLDHTVVLTCTATFVDGLEWAVDPYIPKEDAIKFIINLQAGDFMPVHRDNFLARVTNLSRLNPTTARLMTSTLEVNCSRISNNGTIVECIAHQNDSIHSLTAAVHHAGVPKWAGNTNTHYTMDPVVLELGEMFDGGGVPIDLYIIQLDGTQLETTNSTYSFDIMYNATLSVNISAHNCAGYSPFFPLMIQYRPVNEDISLKGENIQRNTLYTPTPQPTIHTLTRNNRNINTLGVTLIILGIYSFVVSAIARVLPVYLIVKCFKKKWATVGTHNKVNLEENTAYGVTVSGPVYNMENNPLYEMRMESKESHQQEHKLPPVYETVDREL